MTDHIDIAHLYDEIRARRTRFIDALAADALDAVNGSGSPDVRQAARELRRALSFAPERTQP